MSYLRNVLSGASHFLNALTGGDPRFSFSARVGAGQAAGKRWAQLAAAIIDRLAFSRNHCLEHAREEGLLG